MWVGLREEEGELKEEGGMVKEEVLEWGWGTEDKAAPWTSKPHLHPSKEGSTPAGLPGEWHWAVLFQATSS